jgi:hypothetical protein
MQHPNNIEVKDKGSQTLLLGMTNSEETSLFTGFSMPVPAARPVGARASLRAT